MITIGDRLRAERERLEATHKQFAEMAGVAQRTAIDWQDGKTSPNAKQLGQLAEHGVDIGFVLSGIRSVSMPGMASEDVDQYNTLVDEFRALPDRDRESVLRTVQALSNAAFRAGTNRTIRKKSNE